VTRRLRVKLITIPWELEVPTLSLASLAAVTPEERFEVCIVDLLRERLVLDEPTDLVGISASTPSIRAAYALADVYRRRGVKVVLGGHHVTAMPDEGLEHADAVVVGEGETSWMRILDQLLTAPGTVGGVYRDPAPDLATLPPPRVDLMKLDRYSRFAYPLIASRGCPEACSFCFAKRMTFGYRTYPIAHVLDQLRRRPRWVRGAFFVDDNLAGDPEWTRELFRQLRGQGLPFAMQVRHEFSRSPDDLRLAREAGCALISSGYESVNQTSLDRTGKRANAAFYREVIDAIQGAGMVASGNWMFGFDWDGPDVFEETWDFLRGSELLHASFTTEIPFPGTTTWQRYRREGRLLTDDYERFRGRDEVVVRPKGMTPEQLRDGVRWITRRYYSVRHRRRLARAAERLDLFPAFRGWSRAAVLAFLNYREVALWHARMVPALRWLARRLTALHRWRPGDLLRGTNFHARPFEPAGVPVGPAPSASPFFLRAGAMKPGGERLEPVGGP
jgi:radical SAM superfamily enzyme YgiQ (UPF0313 family)